MVTKKVEDIDYVIPTKRCLWFNARVLSGMDEVSLVDREYNKSIIKIYSTFFWSIGL